MGIRVYQEERFRTPLAQERELGLWADRIGRRRAEANRPPQYRILGQYAAVAVEAGAGVLETIGGGRVALEAGDALVIDPKAATRYHGVGGWDTRWVVWNGPEAGVLARLGGLGTGVVKGGGAAVTLAWRRLDPLMERQDFDALLGRKQALLDLIRELAAQDRAGNAANRHPLLARALRELGRTEGPAEPVAALARRLHLSAAHLRRLVKAHTGTSPKQFQAAQRMTRAKEMLAGGCSIKETAERLGFTDVFHFMRLFKRVTGQTAGRFASLYAGRRT